MRIPGALYTAGGEGKTFIAVSSNVIFRQASRISTGPLIIIGVLVSLTIRLSIRLSIILELRRFFWPGTNLLKRVARIMSLLAAPIALEAEVKIVAIETMPQDSI
jgi:hypothetical protein